MIEKEKCIKTKLLYKGRVVSLYVDDVLAPNNQNTIREYVKHPGGVTIIAFNENRIILERQYRYPYDEVIYELPAGKLEKDEDPALAAARELEEETGYKTQNLNYLGKIYPTVGYSNEILYVYEAGNLLQSKQNFDSDEYVELEYFTLDEIIDMIKTNKIKDSKTISAIMFYCINKNYITLK